MAAMSSPPTSPRARTVSPDTFILRLPKAELHLHLEGSVEPATLVEISQRHGDPFTLEQAEALYRYRDFSGFLLAFKAISERLRSPEDYEAIAYNLMKRLRCENVLHAEVYVSVGVCLWRKQDFDAIFEGLERGRERGYREFGVSLLWVFDAVRQFGPEAARQVVEKAVQFKDHNVVGIGIGGDERQAAPQLFRESYDHAAANGLRLTAHAGETTGPESIWGALNLKAERIGHALSAWQDRELMAELVERQIPVEICLTSNLQTNCCPRIEDHPLRKYFDAGVMVTLNTDDPAMFYTSLNREYALAQQVFGFSDEQLREIARNGFEASFLVAEKKIELLNHFDVAV
ncbi:MAG TPA: adenosine deaminase [Terriglobales bacterium]|nr:adenosine deaminase [Terriglobales bacterium]